MNTMKKTAAGAVLGGALLAAGGLGLAHAAPPAQSVVNDGKVNVTVTANGQEIGVLQNVSIDSAEALVTATGPNPEINREALTALDTNGTEVPAITVGNVIYTFTQNAPGNTENAPGQNKPSSSSSSASATAATPTSTR